MEDNLSLAVPGAEPSVRRWHHRFEWWLTAAWIAAIAAVWCADLDYQLTPARDMAPAAHWPAATQLGSIKGPSLVVFVHAYCPCSRATLHELDKLLSRFPSDVQAFCIVSYPVQRDAQAADLADLARQLPRLQTLVDDERRLSAQFGVGTSGAALFYDSDGCLRFAGGLTPQRGHEGPNRGSEALLALVTGEAAPVEQTPIYGCRLPQASANSVATSRAAQK